MLRNIKSICGSLVIAAALLWGQVSAANAQEAYPNGTITFIVPYSAGGAPDFMARIVAQQLQEQIGHPVIVDNRPGSNGNVAASALAAAKPDGYTFLVLEGSLVSINPHLYNSLSYDPKEDFVPVSLLGTAPTFLAVHPSVPVSTFEEFIEYAKAPPEQLNYGSSGIGTPHHLSMEALIQKYGLKMTHIPYKGSGQSVPAVLSGEVGALFASYSAVSEFAKAGRVKLLATNNIERTAEAPDVPAIAEFIPGFDFASRMGLAAHKGTPKERIDTIAAELAKAMKVPAVVEKLAAGGVVAVGSTPEEYAEIIDEEVQRVGAVIEAADIKPE